LRRCCAGVERTSAATHRHALAAREIVAVADEFGPRNAKHNRDQAASRGPVFAARNAGSWRVPKSFSILGRRPAMGLMPCHRLHGDTTWMKKPFPSFATAKGRIERRRRELARLFRRILVHCWAEKACESFNIPRPLPLQQSVSPERMLRMPPSHVMQIEQVIGGVINGSSVDTTAQAISCA